MNFPRQHVVIPTPACRLSQPTCRAEVPQPTCRLSQPTCRLSHFDQTVRMKPQPPWRFSRSDNTKPIRPRHNARAYTRTYAPVASALLYTGQKAFPCAFPIMIIEALSGQCTRRVRDRALPVSGAMRSVYENIMKESKSKWRARRGHLSFPGQHCAFPIIRWRVPHSDSTTPIKPGRPC